MKLRDFFTVMIFVFALSASIIYLIENFCGCSAKKMSKKMKGALKGMDEFSENIQNHLTNK